MKHTSVLLIIFYGTSMQAGWFSHQRVHSCAVQDAAQGDWQGSLKKMVGLLAIHDAVCDDAELLFDTGVAAYRNQEFEHALSYFSDVEKCSNTTSSMVQEAQFNAGNSALQLKRYDQAIEWYDKILKETPDHEKAAHNRAYAQRMRDQKEPPPDQKQSNKDQQQEQNQEQQKQQQSSGNNQDQKQSDSSDGDSSNENDTNQNDERKKERDAAQKPQVGDKQSDADQSDDKDKQKDDTPDKGQDQESGDDGADDNNSEQSDKGQEDADNDQQGDAPDQQREQHNGQSGNSQSGMNNPQTKQQSSGERPASSPSPQSKDDMNPTDEQKQDPASQAADADQDDESSEKVTVKSAGHQKENEAEKGQMPAVPKDPIELLLERQEATDKDAQKRYMKKIASKGVGKGNGQNNW
jgi:Ca-activated chloride channel homolog